ncbi:MAG: hypothetical protein IPG85_07880 [Bacteroidetes bacterium]|nr:hypothetical protein [Bacteroidota bacterium]
MSNQIEETAKLFDSKDKWEHYIDFCKMQDQLKSYFENYLFDKLEESFANLLIDNNTWSYKRINNSTDIKIFLKGKGHEGLTICCDISKESDYYFFL